MTDSDFVTPATAAKPVKAGTSQSAAAARRQAFIYAYLANGHNATQAAISAGYSPRTAYSQGQRLLKRVEVSSELAASAESVAAAAALTAEQTLREVARIAFFDPRQLFSANGTFKAIEAMDENTRASISSLEIEPSGDGNPGCITRRIKLWDKNAALDQAMRHLGLCQRDNAQRAESLKLEVVLV